MSYSADLNKTGKVFESILDSDERTLKDPAYVIAVSELRESGVEIVIRLRAQFADHWPTKFDLTEAIGNQFDAEGIIIPFRYNDIYKLTDPIASVQG